LLSAQKFITLVILPVEFWNLNGKLARFGEPAKLAVWLQKIMHAHPMAGKSWQQFLKSFIVPVGGIELQEMHGAPLRDTIVRKELSRVP
jgi:hypothetical protein